ncbi:hypothetical protein PV05_09667 [Exophiala xenobiotica]|uniref:Uncharacterized protein n=1 Tax=Exophiala xenobiotica TaxID=348802 RepID=A0A0D2ESV4_9EURO|nr:uncharacterized protein PV05_09667 [Exophiala xenobiotica]KIW50889.1 hypothetical protein PV05_09667 [Exophiala xenobiotica]
MFDSQTSNNRYYSNYHQALQKAYEKPRSSKSTSTSSASATSSASSSRTSSAVSLQPTEHIGEWAHQVHMIQNRKYEWCQGCHPRVSTLQVPSQKVLHQHRIMNQPSHAYE